MATVTNLIFWSVVIYENSLDKAEELKCQSIAFTLILTGVYGFPMDRALQIAVSVFRKFLMDNEMNITFVVFDKHSFQLSSQLMGEIDSYIDENYVSKKSLSEYKERSSKNVQRRMFEEDDFRDE